MVTYKDRNKIFKMIKDHQVVLCVLGTGVGKTVVIPKLLAHYFDYNIPIIVTAKATKIDSKIDSTK